MPSSPMRVSEGWARGPPGAGGGHLAVPPVGQLQGPDVAQREAVLQQDAVQLGRRELREGVGDVWGRQAGS